MEDDNDDLNNNNGGKDDGGQDIEKIIADRVNAAVKQLKENLDKAYKARDDALGKASKLEEANRKAELEALEKEGKKMEALQKRFDDVSAENTALKQRIVELTRDVTLREEISGLDFRNDRARKLAYKELVDGLTQDAQGNWVAKDGTSLKEFVKRFAEDEDQAFLFKPKSSSGTGVDHGKSKSSGGSDTKKKSIFEMSQEEVLEAARKGTLRNK